MRAIALLAVLALCPVAFAVNGVDLSSPVSSGDFDCLKRNGYSFAVVRAFMSNGAVDPNAAGTIHNAWAGGMDHVDAYMFPCPTCGNPAGQLRDTVDNLNNHGVKFGMLWLDIEGPQYWMGVAANRDFFAGLVSEAKAAGVHLGVYTSESQWSPIMGDYSAGSPYPLWYAHYDDQPNFGDFSPFGGWGHPAIKQYQGTSSVCGAGVDLNWYPA